MRNTYLIGMMGSGKTTSGRALARLLDVPFVDLDERIVERAGRSINEIFQTEGEPYFRRLERELLAQVSGNQGQVVATGGGIVLDRANGAQMRRTGLVVYLRTSFEVLWERVQEVRDRPLLRARDPRKALAELCRERVPLYENVSDRIFLTDRKTSEAVALEIFKACFESELSQ